MKNQLFGLALLGILVSGSAFAESSASHDDIAAVRALAPAGYDLAQYQIAVLKQTPTEDAEKLAQSNFVYSDFNGDGQKDLAVIFEKNPTLFDYDKNVACTDYDPSEFNSKCQIVPGTRTIAVYLGQKDGSFKLFVSNEKTVLDADSGGVWGDPLVGLTLNKKGSLMVSVYGGSSWRWWHTDTIQFRGNGFYIVGQTDGGIHSIDPEHTEDRKDVNLITGEMSEIKGSRPSVHSRIQVKPLVNLKDFVSPMFTH